MEFKIFKVKILYIVTIMLDVVLNVRTDVASSATIL